MAGIYLKNSALGWTDPVSVQYMLQTWTPTDMMTEILMDCQSLFAGDQIAEGLYDAG